MIIWLNQDKSLIITKYDVIRKDDTDVEKTIFFLFPQEYEDYTLTLTYKIPDDETYSVELEKSEELYKDYIKCTLPSAEDFTKLAGKVYMYIEIIKNDGEETHIFHTNEIYVEVNEVSIN